MPTKKRTSRTTPSAIIIKQIAGEIRRFNDPAWPRPLGRRIDETVGHLFHHAVKNDRSLSDKYSFLLDWLQKPARLEDWGTVFHLAVNWLRRYEANLDAPADDCLLLAALLETEAAALEPHTATATGAEDPAAHTIEGEALALSLLVSHPKWTDTHIAKAVGCNRTTLYEWAKFRAARNIMRGGRLEMPKGKKDANGDMEAWDADSE